MLSIVIMPPMKVCLHMLNMVDELKDLKGHQVTRKPHKDIALYIVAKIYHN